jgi:hypothetical protein
VVLLRLDPSGKLRWSRRFPGSLGWGSRLAIDAGDRAVVAVGVRESVDLGAGAIPVTAPSTVVFATDAAGPLLWATTWAPAADGAQVTDFEPLRSLQIAFDATGNVFALGEPKAQGTTLGPGLSLAGSSTFLAKLSPAGAPLWARSLGLRVHAGSWPLALAVDAQGRPLAAGVLESGDALGALQVPAGAGERMSGSVPFTATWSADGGTVDATALGCAQFDDGLFRTRLASRPGASDRVALHGAFELVSAVQGAQVLPAGSSAGRLGASFRP